MLRRGKGVGGRSLTKKNMTVHGSYSSYMVLKSGTRSISQTYMTAKFLTRSAIL